MSGATRPRKIDCPRSPRAGTLPAGNAYRGSFLPDGRRTCFVRDFKAFHRVPLEGMPAAEGR